jgi:hypothetical protein
LSAARSSQSRIVGHPVELLVMNILEISRLSIQKTNTAKGRREVDKEIAHLHLRLAPQRKAQV